MNLLKRAVKRASVSELAKRRSSIVDALRAHGLDPVIVNGGGSGSLDTTTPESGVTEVTAGSAFYKPHLFDYYHAPHMRRLEPAAFFALEVTRRPAPGFVDVPGRRLHRERRRRRGQGAAAVATAGTSAAARGDGRGSADAAGRAGGHDAELGDAGDLPPRQRRASCASASTRSCSCKAATSSIACRRTAAKGSVSSDAGPARNRSGAGDVVDCMRLGTIVAASGLAACAPPRAAPHATPEPAAAVSPVVASAAPEAPPPPRAATSVESPPPPPRVVRIDNASTQYSFQLTFVKQCCEGPADLVVAGKNGASTQTMHLDNAEVHAEDGKAVVNSTELYGAPGTIDVGDFNFDGREDFAVLSGEDGPYGGPTFTVYLASPSGQFVLSPELGKLTQENLGMFQVDAKKKRLITFAKSGCCFHVMEELAVVHDKPAVVYRETEDATGSLLVITRERWGGGS